MRSTRGSGYRQGVIDVSGLVGASPRMDSAYVQGIYADAGADLARTTEVARQVFDV
jgi:hypothetical protein